MKKCKLCFENKSREGTFLDYFYDYSLCRVCKEQMKLLKKEVIIEGISMYFLYEYDEFFENVLYQYKETRDIALAPIFLEGMKQWFEKKYKDHSVVFVPSEKKKLEERGFYPLVEIWKEINLDQYAPFYKIGTQKSKSGKERKNIKNSIFLNEVDLPQKIVVVDDVVTSGSTITYCVNSLKTKGYNVSVFVLSVKKDNIFIK